MKAFWLPLMTCAAIGVKAQTMTPEQLWQLKRVHATAVSADGKFVFYTARTYDVQSETSTANAYALRIADGRKTPVVTKEPLDIFQQNDEAWFASNGSFIYESNDEGQNWMRIGAVPEGADNIKVSPDKKHIAYSKEVLVQPTLAKDIYKGLSKTTAQIYTDLNYRHWDKWSNGKFSHLFITPLAGGKELDLLAGKPFDCPQKPHGGPEDFAWNPNGKSIVYVCKKKFGKEYALSTNTDIYEYNLNSAATRNLTQGMLGYDMNPAFNETGTQLAFTSMKSDGFEADKADLVVMDMSSGLKRNISAQWDESVSAFKWSKDNSEIYFTAAWKGTEQLFSVDVPSNLRTRNLPVIDQITDGDFDVAELVGETKSALIVSRTDWNHAPEIFSVDKATGKMHKLSHENDAFYASIPMSKIAKRFTQTPDGKNLFSWVIYPPNFDPKKKYPTLLYCQGGPQSALSQFYSFRWNFQLMAAQGYIVIAPNRRGMPGWGTQWNAAISKDWGGAPMADYLAAIDDISKEAYVDKNRLGCVGASYGGYSVFMLAGMHNNRFKTFISHCGLFDLKSWYGTTEELWFANWDIGGNYWSGQATESYTKFSPSNFVKNWNTPIMIIQGGMDFRVPIEQGQQAFQAAQLKGIKSKFLFFPNENHWILHAQNAIVWQHEFFDWLKETL